MTEELVKEVKHLIALHEFFLSQIRKNTNELNSVVSSLIGEPPKHEHTINRLPLKEHPTAQKILDLIDTGTVSSKNQICKRLGLSGLGTVSRVMDRHKVYKDSTGFFIHTPKDQINATTEQCTTAQNP